MFSGIEHFAIASPNPKGLADWYVLNLEFALTWEYGGIYFVEAKNGFIIEIIPSEGDSGSPTAKTPGMRHIAIAVDDFDAALAQLKKQDVKFLGEPYDNAGNLLVFFADADGNLVHLIKRAKPMPRRGV